jgi:uncharacterized protein (DUF1810 family)
LADDPFDLARFRDAQATVYEQALAELRAGRKTSHWMWFVFPQIEGLGLSPMAQHYAIGSLDEARAYLADPVLGPRLIACVEAMLAHGEASAEAILGGIDAVKLRSSLTLFQQAAPDLLVFGQALRRFYGGCADPATLERLR